MPFSVAVAQHVHVFFQELNPSYDLPDGSYPLDFAYRVHSDIGQHAAGFIINGKMEPFTYRLKYGDVIEVITKRDAKPKQRWYETIITGHARTKIRAQINKLKS